MIESPDTKTPNSAAIREQLLAGRSAFGNYNVARLGKLIRRLPEEGRKAFEAVPILLHLNTPGLPGFVDHPLTPHGIFLFSESGFLKTGRKRLGIDKETMKGFLLRRYPVRGVYLVGSAGTHGQTALSDLNYWVLIDSESVDEEQRELFSQKLDGIKMWALENHGQALTFLVLDPDQIRRNDFPEWSKPCVALPHGSLMKEEFYRTLLLIAGQIPFWAVLPAGLDDEEYDRRIKETGRLRDKDFAADDYVDLGHVLSIRNEECPGSLLSEIYRFREDPVRSMIRASLLAHHCFFQEQQGLLCESVKDAFNKPKSGEESPDPFLYGFEKAARFYENMEDEEGLDLLRTCVYLRLSGYPGPRLEEETDLNRELLHRLRRRWAWSSDQGDRIESYADWTEDERRGMEDRILQRLSFLSRLVVQAQRGREGGPTGIGPAHLDALQKWAAERSSHKPDQIPHASSYLRARRGPLSLHVTRQKDAAGTDRWAAYDRANRGSQIDATSLFADPQLLRVLGWIVLNGLYGEDRPSAISFHVQSAFVARRAEDLLNDLCRFFQRKASPIDLYADTAWGRLLVVMDVSLGARQHDIPSAGFLIQNTWGEMSLFLLDLHPVENSLLKCYEIAKRVWQVGTEAVGGKFEYRIYASGTVEDTQAAQSIEEFIQSFRNENSGNPIS